MFDLNLQMNKNQILVPSFSNEERDLLDTKMVDLGLKKHFLLASSGTTGGDWKGYIISERSLLRNAQAVNERLELTKNDKWGASLPFYHIGGLSIYFRAHLLSHKPIDLRPWSPKEIGLKITENNITVLSMVPTQVYDIVHLKIPSPSCLKIVLVGGDFLSQEMANRFQSLGWPLVRTFGMTEISSQLCTGVNQNGHFIPLPIHELKSDEMDNLFVKSQSFFSYLVQKKSGIWDFRPIDNFLDKDGYFKISDKGKLHQQFLEVLGRDDGQIKSSGHLINFLKIKEELDKFSLSKGCWGQMVVQIHLSERVGLELTLHCVEELSQEIIDEFLHHIHPVRMASIKRHTSIPRTNLGKFKES